MIEFWNSLENPIKITLFIAIAGWVVAIWQSIIAFRNRIGFYVQKILFTEEELDFIINYDIKCLMGKELVAFIEITPGRDSHNDGE